MLRGRRVCFCTHMRRQTAPFGTLFASALRAPPEGGATGSLRRFACAPHWSSMNKVFDLICFSHLRWDFVLQRPHHLLSRFATASRVFYIEEPLALPPEHAEPHLDISPRTSSLTV